MSDKKKKEKCWYIYTVLPDGTQKNKKPYNIENLKEELFDEEKKDEEATVALKREKCE